MTRLPGTLCKSISFESSFLHSTSFQTNLGSTPTAVRYSVFILGGYVILDAGYALYRQETPETSLIGIGLAIASIIVMPVLLILKYRLGKAVGSRRLVADSKETLACLMPCVALLIDLGTFYIWRLWWIDPVAALVIAVLIIREGFETLEEGDW